MDLGITSKEERERRKNICKECPLYRKHASYLFGLVRFRNNPQCKECKCLINNLVVFSDMKCSHPNGNKWA